MAGNSLRVLPIIAFSSANNPWVKKRTLVKRDTVRNCSRCDRGQSFDRFACVSRDAVASPCFRHVSSSRTSPLYIFLLGGRDTKVRAAADSKWYKRRIPEPWLNSCKISRDMRGQLRTIILATCLAACAATCQPGLNGRQDWYQCEGLSDLSDLNVSY